MFVIDVSPDDCQEGKGVTRTGLSEAPSLITLDPYTLDPYSFDLFVWNYVLD
jgi:hypothetical protein